MASGCRGDIADPSTRAVCGTLQEMVDALAEGRSVDAVDAYDRMVSLATTETGDAPVLRHVRRMAEVTDAEVDESNLPMTEVPELARQAMRESGDALARLAAACAADDLPVTGMDEAGADR